MPTVAEMKEIGGRGSDSYRQTMLERWYESEKLWELYLAIGGSLDPEPDPQSLFYDPNEPAPRILNERIGLRDLNRSEILAEAKRMGLIPPT